MPRMHDPAHPGEVLADTVLRKDGGLTVSAFLTACSRPEFVVCLN